MIGMVAGHETVKHSAGEYVRYEDGDAIHTNSVEGYFSIFKRGMKGVYQHCAEKHLHRYLAEFDFRYNNRIALGVDDASARRRGAPWRCRQAAYLSNDSLQDELQWLRKPKAGGAKKPPAKKMTQAEQSERFIQAARELGVDETGKEFERAFQKIVVPHKRRTT